MSEEKLQELFEERLLTEFDAAKHHAPRSIKELTLIAKVCKDPYEDSLFSKKSDSKGTAPKEVAPKTTVTEADATDTYDEDVQVTVDAIVSLLEPIIIVVMGLFVGLLVLSILLPILNMSTNIG